MHSLTHNMAGSIGAAGVTPDGCVVEFPGVAEDEGTGGDEAAMHAHASAGRGARLSQVSEHPQQQQQQQERHCSEVRTLKYSFDGAAGF